jgi:hypothetical protein
MSTTEDMLAATVDPTIRLDVDRLTEVRDVIAANPEQHDQWSFEDDWAGECGTTRCVAGWATHLAGMNREQVVAAGYYPVVAGALLGIHVGDPGGDDPENEWWGCLNAHLFKGEWSHEDTLQNLDALIALGKEHDEAARLDEVFGR